MLLIKLHTAVRFPVQRSRLERSAHLEQPAGSALCVSSEVSSDVYRFLPMAQTLYQNPTSKCSAQQGMGSCHTVSVGDVFQANLSDRKSTGLGVGRPRFGVWLCHQTPVECSLSEMLGARSVLSLRIFLEYFLRT